MTTEEKAGMGGEGRGREEGDGRAGGGGVLRLVLGFKGSSGSRAECTKSARFSAVAAAILTAPPKNRAMF